MANENENVKVENQVEATEEKKVEQIADNTLVVPETTEEKKKPGKVMKAVKVGGTILTCVGALAASFLLGKKFGNKG